MIVEVLLETIKRVAGIGFVIIPMLFLVEYLNHKYGDRLVHFFEKQKKVVPFWAALFALLPGCNAAAVVAVLYTKGLVSVGALVAAMIATSDEAIYVFIPTGFNFFPLFAAKFVLAFISGMLIDLFIYYRQKKAVGDVRVGYCCSIHKHSHGTRGMITHSLRHGLKILTFIFIVLFAFNYIKDAYSLSTIFQAKVFSVWWQPLMAGVFGLIPGCGTSVVLGTLYASGLLTFGGALAGLSVAAGDTILLLIASKVKGRQIALIVATTFVISVLAGYLVTLFI